MMREERPKTLNRPVNAKLEQGHSAFTTNGSVATECQSQEQATDSTDPEPSHPVALNKTSRKRETACLPVEHRKRRLDAALGR